LESSSCFLPFVGIDPCDELIQLSPSSCGGGFLVNGVGRMICSMWRHTSVEAINRRTPRTKGVTNLAKRPLGRSEQAGRPRPFLGRFGPVFLPCCFPHDSLFVYTCMWAFDVVSSRLRLESLLCKLRCFLVESLKTCTLTLRSSGHLESYSSCVLTLIGLHDLLPKCLVNLPRKSPL
jgi:hypothetical protein